MTSFKLPNPHVCFSLLFRHRERSVAIHHLDFTDYISRGWTATSSSLLTVTQSNMNVIASVAWQSNILQAHEFYETLGLLVKKIY